MAIHTDHGHVTDVLGIHRQHSATGAVISLANCRELASNLPRTAPYNPTVVQPLSPDRLPRSIAGPGFARAAALALASLARRNARVHRLACRFYDAVAGAPRWSPLRPLAVLRATLRGEIRWDDVLRIVAALEGAGVACWLAGGWGIDALLGRQTRRHDDLDLVIGGFDHELPVACDALESLGLRVVSIERSPLACFLDHCSLAGGTGHRVDLLSVDWTVVYPVLDAAFSAAGGGVNRESSADAFVTGTVAGRELPCLSPTMQLIVHAVTGWGRSVGRHDLRLFAARYPRELAAVTSPSVPRELLISCDFSPPEP